MPIRIKTIRTSSGPEIELGSLSVLVGPNNSGKSQTLHDIRDFIITGSNERLTILKAINVEIPSMTNATNGLLPKPHPNPDYISYSGVTFNLRGCEEFPIHKTWLETNYKGENQSEILRVFGKFWVAHLDAESRLHLASPVESFDTRRESPSNALQSFFISSGSIKEQLRNAFREAFHMDIALDWAAMRKFYLKVGPDFGEIPDEKNALDSLLRSARELANQGDGYRSFAGIILAMLSFPDRVLLLDEPDAFLHPAQARILGRWLANHVKESSMQVILATHSADFLWGIISANPAAGIIRLNRSGDRTDYQLISSETIENLIKSPLLSSQPVLDSLFQKGVVVCEGDPDRAVYQTVAHKQLQDKSGEDFLFIHTNGKDTLKTPVKLLRNAGIPVCAIVDMDVLNSELVLKEILRALKDDRHTYEEIKILRKEIADYVIGISQEQSLSDLISSVKSWSETPINDIRIARKKLEEIIRRSSRWDDVKARGLEYFPDSLRTEVQRIIELCAEHGLFIVPKGELEGWISLDTSKGKEWNRRALEELQADNCPTDLKIFVNDIISWLQRNQKL